MPRRDMMQADTAEITPSGVGFHRCGERKAFGRENHEA
jgi:hypothetical protein